MTRNLARLERAPRGSARKNAPALLPRAPSATRVTPVYWDPHFREHPEDVAAFDEFLRVLFQSSWMSGLVARGIAPVELATSSIPRDAAPARLSLDELGARLRRWVATRVIARPVPGESSLFLVMTPLGMELDMGVASHGSSAASPSHPGFSFAVVPLMTTIEQILEVHSLPLSQVLARALVARTRGR